MAKRLPAFDDGWGYASGAAVAALLAIVVVPAFAASSQVQAPGVVIAVGAATFCVWAFARSPLQPMAGKVIVLLAVIATSCLAAWAIVNWQL